MGTTEVLDHLKEATPEELAIVRDTAASLLAMNHLGHSEFEEIAAALCESESQFELGEGIPSAEDWRRLGI